MKTISRRDFFKSATAGGLGVTGAVLLGGGAEARAIPPIKRAGKPALRLSLAAYSFREFFKDASHKRKTPPPPDKQIDLFNFIDFCADHGCEGTELTSYYFPPEVKTDVLVQLHRHAFLRGLAISGTSVGNNFARPKGPDLDKEIADVKRWIDHAAVLTAPHIRVFAGSAKGISDAEARKMCIGALEECCDYAGKKGIFLGLENHGGIVARPEGMLEIIQAVKSPWLGVNLDTGNFQTDDPYADLAKCAPYAVNVQVKVEMRAKGKQPERADLSRLIQILRDVNYQGYVVLEYEAKEDPWQAVPGVLKELKRLCA